MILLSLLIPSLVTRKKQLSELLTQIEKQQKIKLESLLTDKEGTELKKYKGEHIEVIIATDEKQITTGAKRNKLLKEASGKYIAFIDDDDCIYPSYTSELLKGCITDFDCIGFKGLITTDGKNPIHWQISKDLKDQTVKRGTRIYYLRHTNHLSPVKREIALQAGFPDKSNAEDSEYSKRLKESGLLLTEHNCPGLLYHYKFSRSNKEYK